VGYLIKSIVGLALFLGAIVLFNVKLLQLLDIGTCASGNVPYEIAPGYECPEGTGTDILLVSASVFVGLIGALIFAFRGEPPWGGGKRRMGGLFGFGTFAWGLFFTGTGATMLIAALSDDSLGADSELGATIVGITFLVMGLPALLLALWGFVKSFGARKERPAPVAAGIGGAGGIVSRMSAGHAIGKLERLQKLRESGAINDREFEREKAKILADT
jgi:hypothetical protein